MSGNTRVRFAPSPTGPLHIGGLRTALFNYLFARKRGGTFILRIEDTDQTRFVPGAEDYILESLRWCGLEPDEGPAQGGGYGPYRQSERKEMYRDYALSLVRNGKAYYAFDTPEDLDELRKRAEETGETFVYDASVRDGLFNSLNMSEEELQVRLASEEPYVIRFRFYPDEELVMQDLIRGEVVVNTSTLDDKILFKSDGMPTYHLANVVDDNRMAITHVIRGEEWLPSLPLHVSLYKAFGWEHMMPEFAHLPLILKPTGKGKLSKRDGEKGGFPVFPIDWKDPETGEVSPGYREAGYQPEAVINLLALLGWNPGTEQELFSLDELVDQFQLEKVGKSGSRFDPEKARWFNHQHLQRMPSELLVPLFEKEISAHGHHPDRARLETLVSLLAPRIGFIKDLWEEAWFFFEAPRSYDPKVVQKRWKEDAPGMMRDLAGFLGTLPESDPETLEHQVKTLIAEKGWGMGAVMNAWRLLLVGEAKGPGLFDLAVFLGLEEVVRRMHKGIETL
ncbi:MAG: glutamate--tRNA ligase [Bacteroidales bacterium]